MKKVLDVFILHRREQVVIIVALLLWIAVVVAKHQRDKREAADSRPTATAAP